MNKRSKLAALLGAGLLTFAIAGVALADGTVNWNGTQGLNDAGTAPQNTQCDADNAAGTVTWILSLGGDNTVSSASLTLSGAGAGAAAGTTNGTKHGNEFHFQTAWPDDFTALSASAAYVGDLGSGNVNLTVSHGCPAEVTTPTETPGGGGGGEATATPEVPGGGGGGDITQPPTDAIGSTGSSGPTDTAWLLVVALGVLLASIVVLTPARAKSRR